VRCNVLALSVGHGIVSTFMDFWNLGRPPQLLDAPPICFNDTEGETEQL